MSSDWPQIKARLEGLLAEQPSVVDVSGGKFYSDIRAALQRVGELEKEARLNRQAAEKHYAYGESQKELVEAAEAKLARVVEARDKMVAHVVSHPGPCCIRGLLGLNILGKPLDAAKEE